MGSSDAILHTIQATIDKWHMENSKRGEDCVIVTDEVKKIKRMGECRDNLMEIVAELAVTNTEMWHEEDKVRSECDDVVLKAIRNINPLNQHRNDLIEEIDEYLYKKYESL